MLLWSLPIGAGSKSSTRCKFKLVLAAATSDWLMTWSRRITHNTMAGRCEPRLSPQARPLQLSKAMSCRLTLCPVRSPAAMPRMPKPEGAAGAVEPPFCACSRGGDLNNGSDRRSARTPASEGLSQFEPPASTSAAGCPMKVPSEPKAAASLRFRSLPAAGSSAAAGITDPRVNSTSLDPRWPRLGSSSSVVP